jgi:hypothetical protein
VNQGPDLGKLPISPSGRQDLNLRPLDPQYGQRVALTCGNGESAARRGEVQRTSASFRPAWRNAVLHICSIQASQCIDGALAPELQLSRAGEATPTAREHEPPGKRAREEERIFLRPHPPAHLRAQCWRARRRSAAPLIPASAADDRLEQLLAGWLLGCNSPHTRRAYARDLSGWIDWCAQLEVDPLQAGRMHVDAWARHLTEQRRLAPATVARRLAAVSAFYRWCVLEHHLDDNPAVHVRRPEVDPDASTTLGLTGEQARALLACAADHSPRMHALVALLLVDGLRISEALALDIDRVRGDRVVQLHRKGAAPPALRSPRWSPTPSTPTSPSAPPGAKAGPAGEQPTRPLFVTRTDARWPPATPPARSPRWPAAPASPPPTGSPRTRSGTPRSRWPSAPASRYTRSKLRRPPRPPLHPPL